MVTTQDIQLVLGALESIEVHGSKDIGTMKNIFDYLVMLQQKIDEQTEQESESDE